MPAAPLAWPLLAVAVGCWCLNGVMIFFLAARIVAPDSSILFIWWNAYTWWVYLPAYAIAGAAFVLRRRWLLPAAGVVAVFHALWIIPDYRGAEAIPPQAYEAPRLTLMTANVFFENEDFGPIAAEIMAADPDIVFIQEYGAELEAELARRGAFERYPYREVVMENRFFGLATFSKLPLLQPEEFEAGGRPHFRATVEVEGVPVRLYNVHPTSPGLGNELARHWNDAWREITGEVSAEEGPVILAGDFNMNQHHRWYRELKSDGMTSCHEERGRGNATTWPQMRKLRPIRVDHVFHSRGIICLSVREGEGAGSDHKPVIAELAILPR